MKITKAEYVQLPLHVGQHFSVTRTRGHGPGQIAYQVPSCDGSIADVVRRPIEDGETLSFVAGNDPLEWLLVAPVSN